MKTIIRNARIINEGNSMIADILIANERIEKIGTSINLPAGSSIKEINAEGLYVLPGVIDDQVHFREPGLTHKGTIFSESRAAVAGGITSFMEMPNTIPNTLTQELLEEKYHIASNTSLANYSFFMGINQNNLEEALKTNNETVCGITDDGLYFNNDEGTSFQVLFNTFLIISRSSGVSEPV
jgi:dihydroorotase